MSSYESPVKTRELHNHHFDSTIWNDFKFRDDDIIIAKYGGQRMTDLLEASQLGKLFSDPDASAF